MKTKFNIGDEVWFIRGDRPRSSVIKSIYITDKESIMYNTALWSNLYESEVFKTAKQAIESLPNAEYILVTDNPNIKSDTWEVKYIYDIMGTDGNTSTFDKCYFIRMFPFKFVNTNIVVRIDGDVEIKKNLDIIIEKFIEGNYDMSLMIHPDKNNFLVEYNTWHSQ